MKESTLFLVLLGISSVICTSPDSPKTIAETIVDPPVNNSTVEHGLKRGRLQLEEDGEEDRTLSPSQVNFIGNNVAKVVAASLTGNVGGIFSGGLNLLNTNNRVNSLLGRFGVSKPVAQAPNGTYATNTNTNTNTNTPNSESSSSTGDDEDDDEGNEDSA